MARLPFFIYNWNLARIGNCLPYTGSPLPVQTSPSIWPVNWCSVLFAQQDVFICTECRFLVVLSVSDYCLQSLAQAEWCLSIPRWYSWWYCVVFLAFIRGVLQLEVKKVADTRLLSVGFRSWSRFLAVSLQVMWVINLAVGCHFFSPGQQLPSQPLRGLLLILLLGEQRHNGCEQSA